MPAAKTTISPRNTSASSIVNDHGAPATRWMIRYTTSVGRNRKNAVRTADRGISSRGNDMFITRLPPPVTEPAPALMQPVTK